MISYTSSFIKTPTAPVEANNPSGPEGAITTLPPEIFKLICSNLDMSSLGNMSSVSKICDVLSSEDEIWKKFENEFEIKAPKIRTKETPSIKEEVKISITTLKRVDKAIKKLFFEEERPYYCSLAQILFDGNIHSIKKVFSCNTYCKFEINLERDRKACFDHPRISSLQTGKKVHLTIVDNYFYPESCHLECEEFCHLYRHREFSSGFVFTKFLDEQNIIKMTQKDGSESKCVGIFFHIYNSSNISDCTEVYYSKPNPGNPYSSFVINDTLINSFKSI